MAAAHLAEASVPGAPGSASDRLFYRAQLGPAGDFGARGMLFIEVAGGELRVRVHANGLEPGEPIPQHIHVNAGCNPGGAALVNLDAGLTVPPNEAHPVETDFPVASEDGVVKYEATRSLASLRAAFNTYAGTSFATDADLLEFLDLENRNAHMHVAFGPPFPAVNCGAIDRVN